jgi:GNAT superfamily N-acetyltransferase
MIAIRPAAEHETALILGFIRDLAIYERLEHAVVATEANLRRTLFGPHPVAHALFACIDDEPVGFAIYFYNYSTFLGRPGVYLEDLYVRPAARGRGVGRAVLAHLARLALEQGCGRLEWSVLDWNEPAIRFYRALEAVAADDWTTFRLSGEALARLATHSHSRPPPA